MAKRYFRRQVQLHTKVMGPRLTMFIFSATASALEVANLDVKYVTLPGWKQSIAKCRKFSDLPAEAQAYVRKIEELIEVPGK